MKDLPPFLSYVFMSVMKWSFWCWVCNSDNLEMTAVVFFCSTCWWFNRLINDKLNLFAEYNCNWFAEFWALVRFVIYGLWFTKYVPWGIGCPYIIMGIYELWTGRICDIIVCSCYSIRVLFSICWVEVVMNWVFPCWYWIGDCKFCWVDAGHSWFILEFSFDIW